MNLIQLIKSIDLIKAASQLTQINFSMRLPKCYQLNNERVMTAYGLNVHFILQLAYSFISDDLKKKKRTEAINSRISQ